MKGTLIKRITDDGLMDVLDHVPIGKVYDLVPGSRRRVAMFNVDKQVEHDKEIVNVEGGGFFPTELLEIVE
jgi:hypothetical protein